MMRAFRTRVFSRWMRKVALTDAQLRMAVLEISNGLIDARLGGCLIKKRVGRLGEGKRGGMRVLAATNHADRCVFLLGFLKSTQSNIDKETLAALQQLAKTFVEFTDQELEQALHAGAILEIIDETSIH
jgi:hypothetical protein